MFARKISSKVSSGERHCLVIYTRSLFSKMGTPHGWVLGSWAMCNIRVEVSVQFLNSDWSILKVPVVGWACTAFAVHASWSSLTAVTFVVGFTRLTWFSQCILHGSFIGDHNGQIDVNVNVVWNVQGDMDKVFDRYDGGLHRQLSSLWYGQIDCAFQHFTRIDLTAVLRLTKNQLQSSVSVTRHENLSLIQGCSRLNFECSCVLDDGFQFDNLA